MRNERYSIEVSDDAVVIYGDLSIEETFPTEENDDRIVSENN